MCMGAVGAWAAPPESAPQQEVTVVVVNAGVDPARPVQKVRVSLGYIDGSTLITVTGATRYDATNSEGKATLLVALEAAQSGGLRINIEGASDLVIYEPADGQLTGLPSTVTIKLLTKGSPALLGPAQINALLHRLSLQNKQLTQENRAVKGELAAAQSQKPDELTAAMAEWARANGFAIADVDKQVRQWAEEIQQGKKQATDEQKALAELALKHYGVAAQLFDQAADDIGQSMDEDEKKFLEERRTKLRDLVDKSFQSANAYQLDLKYHQATQILEQARDRAAAEHNRYPEDAALRSIWLNAIDGAADARAVEGENKPAGDSALLLSRSVDDLRKLLTEYTRPNERDTWAMTQNDLGVALLIEGERSSGAQAAELMTEAVAAEQAALEVFTKADFPQRWAGTQNNLGMALTDLATASNIGKLAPLEMSGGAQVMGLLAQAAETFRAALQVFTRAETPQVWARTQNNLALALMNLGDRTDGVEGENLLAQAIQAYRAALEVQTKVDSPLDWAQTQNNLGITLMAQGQRSTGAQAVNLFAQAVQAYRAALEVQTKVDLPLDWAIAQYNLGIALSQLAGLSSGRDATDLRVQAIAAFKSTLEVYSKADQPVWAKIQLNLEGAFMQQQDYSNAAEVLEAYLEDFPTDSFALPRAIHIYHDKLFQYERAYELTQRKLKLGATPETELGMIEDDLTTSRFEECEKLAGLANYASFNVREEFPGILIHDAMKLACQWGAGQKVAAQETEKMLLLKATRMEKTGWEFGGTLHYLASSPAFSTGRASWIALFQSLQDGDGAAMAGALKQLEEVMKN